MDKSNGRREAVKIVIISTQYVETDVTSFKSVVQKLTDLSFKDFDTFLTDIPPLHHISSHYH
ncbi:VQ motif-containing protein 1-like [Senna tora]|uniref:VQ motif-containing protein 1-like n=1 Tax=Senna tora TaxID=362788 RepID=A0A834THY1_9FABA|nr:VQ motif-containing protein 1-like [Senna tora]